MRLILLFLMALIAGPAVSQTATGKISRVSDGDTLTVCGTGLSKLQDCFQIRVNDLNTPEKRLCKPGDKVMASCEPCAKGARLGVIATGAAKRMAPVGTEVVINVISVDHHGRLVADVTLPDGTDWADEMKERGYGVSYPCPNGRCVTRPRPWCKDE